MSLNLDQCLDHFNSRAKEYFAHRRAETQDVSKLIDSIEYSFFNGGKRFRPMLCYAVSQALGLDIERITPFAMAVESIHTYSLIHDDLPCMDDDQERRGQPTNHIKFSEDIALLAGDSLLTEAFLIVAQCYEDKSSKLIEILSQGSGLAGMIRGQVLDLGQGKQVDSLSDLIHLHEMKTGQLISMCFTGPGYLTGQELGPLKDLGTMLGLAFQVKDDILDVDEQDSASFIAFLGLDGTKQYLQSLTEKIHRALKELSLDHELLVQLIDFNLNRER